MEGRLTFGQAELSTDYDVIVLGAGAGGMAAAVVAANEGMKTLVIEKTGQVGGTTAISGGMVWAPNNIKMRAAGAHDSMERAEAYLNAVVGNLGGADLRRTFLEAAPEAVDYFDRNTAVRLVPLNFYPDYYPDAPGATLGGRVMEPLSFDARELGTAFPLLRAPLPEFTLFGGMMVARPDIAHFRNLFRSLASTLRAARLTLSYMLQRLRLHRGANLVLGNALAGRLMKSLIDLDVQVRLNTDVARLVEEDGRVSGVEVITGAGTATVSARRGVILATGGFSQNQRMRRHYLPSEAGALSAVSAGSTGDGLSLGMAVGGAMPNGNVNNAFWVPVSSFTRKGGEPAVYPRTVTDRGKPGMLAVGRDGRRFTNESDSYHEFVQTMFRANAEHDTLPCHLICDARSLWQYGLGAIKPMAMRTTPYRKSGYLITAPSLRALAELIGADPDNLADTVTRYNADAESGVDGLFGRGGNAYHRYVGDAENRPNPCMRPVEKPPFHAVKLEPGDLGTAGGLGTGVNGEVVNAAGAPIAGLYACGNDMNSVMAGCYPGPGITLGPALVFGYLAAKHIAAAQRRRH